MSFFKKRFSLLMGAKQTTSNEYITRLRGVGVSIGKGTHFFAPDNTIVDTQRPWLLSIGMYCKITSGVIILCHDYSRSVLRRVYGEVVEGAKPTTIGDNVFIGMNSIILMGCNIGNNTIVGAGSVCSGSYPPNSVIAGNPAKVICTLEQFYNKKKNNCVVEAQENARCFRQKFGRWPNISEMGAFFPLYLNRTSEALKSNNILTKMSGDDEQEIIDAFMKSSPVFDDYESFLAEIEYNSKE